MKLKNIKKFIISNKKIVIIFLLTVLIYNSLKPLREGKTNKKNMPNMEHLDKILKMIEANINNDNSPQNIMKKNPITPKEKQRFMMILNKAEYMIESGIKWSIFRSENATFQAYLQRMQGLILGKDMKIYYETLERIKLAKKVLQNDNGGSAAVSSSKSKSKSGSYF
jgi:hypothetical protein